MFVSELVIIMGNRDQVTADTSHVSQRNPQTSLVLPSGFIIFVVDSQKAPPLLMEPGVTKDVAVHVF